MKLFPKFRIKVLFKHLEILFSSDWKRKEMVSNNGNLVPLPINNIIVLLT